MTLWQLIVRQIRLRGLSSTLTALSVSLGVMLVTSILLLQHQMEEHFLKPGRGYHVVVGAPGSALQLVLNAVYHMDKSPGLMPMRWWPVLEENDSVALAVPYCLGDSFRGYRVVGTTDALFDRRFPHPEGEGEEKLADGRMFNFDREALYRRLRGLGSTGFDPTQPEVEEIAEVAISINDQGQLQLNGEAVALESLSPESRDTVVVTASEAADLGPLVNHLRGEVVRIHIGEASEGPSLALRIGETEARLYGDPMNAAAIRTELESLGEGARASLTTGDDTGDEAVANTLRTLREAGVASIEVHGQVQETEVEIAEPPPLSHGVFEAVLGWEVATELGVRVGDEIEPTHGVEGGVVHDHVHLWQVVGILKRTDTPVDKVVWINMDSFFGIEEHLEGALIPGTRDAGLSSILLFPRPGVHKAMLLSSLNREPELSVADVSEQIRNLFSIVGSVDTIFMIVSVMVVILGVLSILVAIYNTMSERRREVAILRAIGARRMTVFGAIVGEAAALTLLGAIAGVALGHVLVLVSAGRVEEAAGFVPEAFVFLPIEALVAAIVVAGGALAGLVPAWKAYRTDVAQNLRPLA